MQDDKIFNNTYGDFDVSTSETSFKIEAGYEDNMDPDDQIHYGIMMKRLDELIKGSEFKRLNEVTSDGINQKLSKIQINQVFYFVVKHMGNEYTRTEIFSALSDYFDVFPNKFYSSLSNKYKDELICELDKKYNILEKRNIRKLF